MKKQSPIYVFVYTTAVACFFGLVLSAFAQFTEEKIQANKKAKKNREILTALGYRIGKQATSEEVLQKFKALTVQKQYKPEGREKPFNVWVGYSRPGFQGEKGSSPHRGEIIGYAFEIGGSGFWGPIRGIMALEKDLETIRGVSFYQDEETPGLGHEINKKWFQEGFKGKTYRNRAGEIEFVFTRDPKERNEFDTITGATETVKSVKSFLQKNMETFLKISDKYGIGERTER